MDASRLLEVLDDIEAEFEDGLARLISGLVQQYTAARDSPTVDNAPLIQTAFASLAEFIDKGRFSQYPPSKTGILHAIGGKTRVGPGLRNRLDDLMSIPGQTLAPLRNHAHKRGLASKLSVYCHTRFRLTSLR